MARACGLIAAVALVCAACGSGSTGAPASAPPTADGSTGQGASAAADYTPPAEGTTSLVQSVMATRAGAGQIAVEGRLRLPEGTRIWVDLYPANAAPGADPVGRAELYLGPGGSFAAGPFKVSGVSEVQVQLTSHFSRSWQPGDVLALVGVGGLKLPKSALRPSNPQAPQSGGYLETTVKVPVQ